MLLLLQDGEEQQLLLHLVGNAHLISTEASWTSELQCHIMTIQPPTLLLLLQVTATTLTTTSTSPYPSREEEEINKVEEQVRLMGIYPLSSLMSQERTTMPTTRTMSDGAPHS